MILTVVWVFGIYIFSFKSFSLFINLIEESNFLIMFFIFLVELLRKIIQFFTIMVRLLVNVFFGEIIKFLVIYKGINLVFVFFGLLEFFILLIQSVIFYYILTYYCND